MIKARLRLPSGWRDGCILNLSSRGMMIRCADPPPTGSYVEIRRGGHIVVGRVAWSRAHRFGIRSQDSIDIDGLVREPDRSTQPVRAGWAPPPDRRREQRSDVRHERSRTAAKAMEFAALVIMGLAAAGALFDLVDDAFAAPIAAVAQALDD